MIVIKAFFGNRTFVLFLLPVFVVGYELLQNFFPCYFLKFNEVNLGFFGLYQENIYTSILSGILVFITAIVINNLFNRHEFREKNTYLPSLLYVVLASYNDACYHLSGVVVSSLLIAFALAQVFKLNQNEDGRKDVFNAAFLLGLSACFYPVLFLLFPLLFIVVWVLRPFVFRESALMVTGFILPVIYAGVWAFYSGYEIDNTLFSPSGTVENRNIFMIVGGLIALLMLIMIAPLIQKLNQSGIRLKKLFRIIFFITIAFSLVFLVELVFMNKLGGSFLMVLPLSMLLTYAFGEKELRPFPSFIFYLIFILSVGKFFYSFNF